MLFILDIHHRRHERVLILIWLIGANEIIIDNLLNQFIYLIILVLLKKFEQLCAALFVEFDSCPVLPAVLAKTALIQQINQRLEHVRQQLLTGVLERFQFLDNRV